MSEEVATSRAVQRGWIRLIGTLASLGLLVWILGRQDWQSIRSHAAGIPFPMLAAAIFLFLASQAIGAGRWWILMRTQGIAIGYGRAFRLNAAGLFASNFLPGTIGGDVLRAAGLIPLAGSSVAGVASVVVDRIIGISTMVLVLPLSLATFGPFLGPWLSSWLAVVGFPERIRQGIAGLLRRARRVFGPWLSRPQSLLLAIAASAGAVVCYQIGMWAVARGLAMQVTLLEVAGVTGITYFLSQIPVSLNALGIREAAMIALYTQLGASPEQATALALITRVLVMLSSLHGALWAPGLLSAARARPAQGKP